MSEKTDVVDLPLAVVTPQEKKKMNKHLRGFLIFVIMVMGFLLFNLVFAGLYFAPVGGPAVGKGKFSECFFFSVQTMSTVGYGHLYPQTTWASWLSTIQLMLILAGVVTGASFLAIASKGLETMNIDSKNLLEENQTQNNNNNQS